MKVKFFSLSLIDLHIGAFDYGREHGIRVCLLNFFFEFKKMTAWSKRPLCIRVGHDWGHGSQRCWFFAGGQQ